MTSRPSAGESEYVPYPNRGFTKESVDVLVDADKALPVSNVQFPTL